MFAELMIHHMPWLGWRVVAQWQIDAATVQFRLAPAQRGVGFFGFTVMKLPRQFAMGIRVACQQDDP
ncbi:hypothetical protein D3C73_1445510 [compost metagenome]